MPQVFDKSSKWLLEHHGSSVLHLAGLRDIAACRSLQSDVVQTRHLPDGLLEVRLRGQSRPRLILVEIATYPEPRVVQQAADDLMLVYQARGVMPELLTLVLRERGQYRVPSEFEARSELGWATLHCSWKVVELWQVPAEELLAAGDVGIIPWVPLTRFEGSPRDILQRCRDRIDREAPHQERPSLLAVTQVLTKLRFPDPQLLTLFGGRQIMIDSPLIRELVAENTQETLQQAIVRFLEGRFGTVSDALAARIKAVRKKKDLDSLVSFAGQCPDLAAFEARLPIERPRPASSRTPARRRKPSAEQ
ncbi:MAG TPA: hypothetical protein VMF69_08870 [Gemmataceae bacterium]|nr:hypothetical protein [Gemmataceae bacterium]